MRHPFLKNYKQSKIAARHNASTASALTTSLMALRLNTAQPSPEQKRRIEGSG